MPRRVVAVKVLKAPITEPRDQSDFEAEADAMARLSSHPSIVSVFSAGIAVDGRPYLTMEYCPDSMRERTRGNPASLELVLDAGVRLAGALETAHQSGILHRDIKPSNVLITSTGRPALTDFGISLLNGQEGSEAKQQALSVPWASPEVITGITSGTVASEIWSLGATLYTFAAGISPFESLDRSQNTQAKMTSRISQAKYTPIPGAHGYEPFDSVLQRAMSVGPEQRFATMHEFGEALRGLQRAYGFDVTALDLVQPGWITPAADAAHSRGPVITSIREATRAEQRASHARVTNDPSEGILVAEPRGGALKSALIGAGTGILVIGAVLAAGFGLGWFG